ncbi:putative protein serine/threonine kinase [Yamadazyma tenuis]|uniref:non-specific serine/threonine protein kinase n=1 Tax=Candida tenuis (strain ATCC 10573 / BCRC 21748 / CBS 615 / JCM 9827 / NBRC 10315 / NRRL Y-1498 / VKM Y-70) TaxID=590646 RepID=G3BAK9_CANTC|nr:Pkinase-domain-containing protein [Yamadazyma tenuis ATCC 10573]EGV61431.1 Pkinase-domain-containing protein [Yamadazyma tenuis ATCC 10573]WEJ92648.1 putative protein serine/threonine kinase [Yamadazyma tenuis]
MGVDDYELEAFAGRGAFGDVYRAHSLKHNTIVAIKVINLEETSDDIKTFVSEIHFLSSLRSEYITKYFETIVQRTTIWIVMEYCGGGSCYDLLRCHKKFSEEVTAYIIRDVLRGLSYLHNQKRVHRDIKSANILLSSDGKIKLADFGVSGEITMTHLKRETFVGTPFWMAPEVIAARDMGHDQKADIWSTGITTIELITGEAPLSGQDPRKIIFDIPRRKPPVLTGINFSENIKNFVKYCLVKDPKNRPSANTLLHHRFITGVRRHVNIIQLIKEKDEWMKTSKRKVRRPRNELQLDETTTSQMINWNFDSTRIGAPSIVSRKVSPMALDSLELSFDIPFKSSSELSSPETPLSSGQIQNDHLPSDQLSPNSSPQPAYTYTSCFFYCMKRVEERANLPSTKRAVGELIKDLVLYENDQPGICYAIFEEILKFKHVVGE